MALSEVEFRRSRGKRDRAVEVGEVGVFSRRELAHCNHWPHAFSDERKDFRYYELVEDTLHPEFEYRYFVIKDATGTIRAVQPFFILDQDMLVGISPAVGPSIELIRRFFPRFMRMRTLMIGCVAGEGHLDGPHDTWRAGRAREFADAVVNHAKHLGAKLVVMKEFLAQHRATLGSFIERGFARVPGMPMTGVSIDYASFDEYMTRALNSATRTKLRRKFRAAANAAPIEMSVINDITPVIDDVYPLYLNVYHRSKLRFEKLTKEYLCGLGTRMADKVRFFVWRQNGRIVAFTACMMQGEVFYPEYIGLDYSVALELHLYHYAYRDMVSWAMANGYKELRSSALNYDPKLHFRHRLLPVDLYVKHTSSILNPALKWLLPLLEPTRHDKTLPKFANYHELWGTLPAKTLRS
jgi:Acetyltransferase (GNAT) domain